MTLGSSKGLTIVHAASLDAEDEPAFVHGVALARRSESKLVSIHADGGAAAKARMKTAVDTLVRWGHLPSGSVEGDEAKLGMSHERRVHDCCADDHAETLLDATRNLAPDLLVMTTHAKAGVDRLVFGSIAEAFALSSPAPTLFLPTGSRPMVDAKSGSACMCRVVVAAGDEQCTKVGIEYASWLADVLGAGAVEIELVHAGESLMSFPVPVPSHEGMRIRAVAVRRSIEDAIVDEATRVDADLIVMATRGHDTLGDVLAGSHTERVLRRARRPLLSIPLSVRA